jgi:hypothetical protein
MIQMPHLQLQLQCSGGLPHNQGEVVPRRSPKKKSAKSGGVPRVAQGAALEKHIQRHGKGMHSFNLLNFNLSNYNLGTSIFLNFKPITSNFKFKCNLLQVHFQPHASELEGGLNF